MAQQCKIWVFNFGLFLRNCWLLVLFFHQAQQWKPEFWTFFSALWLSNLELGFSNSILLGFQNSGFQFPVSNPNWIWKPQKINFKPEKGFFWCTLTRPVCWVKSEKSLWFQRILDRKIVLTTGSECLWKVSSLFLMVSTLSSTRPEDLPRSNKRPVIVSSLTWKYRILEQGQISFSNSSPWAISRGYL